MFVLTAVGIDITVYLNQFATIQLRTCYDYEYKLFFYI